MVRTKGQCWVFALFLLAGVVACQGAASDWRIAAERALTKATAALASGTNKVQANWHYARACFDLGEFATNNTERASIAKKGIAAARTAVAADPDSAAAHYYLGMNLGQLARTRLLSALRMVDEMEREFLRTRQLDPEFDYAGADRNLGLLYRDAPTIGSVGNRRKAKQRLELAVQVAPAYPENRLNLIESYLKWGDVAGAKREMQALDLKWEEAKLRLSGPAWESSWADWEARRLRLAERLSHRLPELRSPHNIN